MKKLAALCVAALVVYLAYSHHPVAINNTPVNDSSVARPIDNPGDASEISGTGTVVKILRDDDEGDKHQRFILRLPSGKTLLVAHNIDIAPRVAPLSEGDTVEYKGEYVSNPRGGVVHWTHHDPSGKHPSGWLKHDGQTFQ